MKKIKKTEFLSKNTCKKLMLNLGQKREWTWLKLFMALMISKSLSWCTMGSKSFWSCNCTSGTFRSEHGCRALVTKVSNELLEYLALLGFILASLKIGLYSAVPTVLQSSFGLCLAFVKVSPSSWPEKYNYNFIKVLTPLCVSR